MSDNLDKVFYINLKKRFDRKKLIESELNNFNLNWERYEAIYTPNFGILGCTLSHLNVLQIAKERKYKNILILEDDFTFLVTKDEFEKELMTFFSQNTNFDVCMISYNIIKDYKLEYYHNVNKVIEAQTASGYIVNFSYYDKLIELFKNNIPLLYSTKQHWNYANDQIWKQLQPNDNWFYFKKRIGKQRPSFSDNSNTYCNLDC